MYIYLYIYKYIYMYSLRGMLRGTGRGDSAVQCVSCPHFMYTNVFVCIYI